MSLGDVIPPVTQDDSPWFSNFSVEPPVLYEETLLVTQDMPIQFGRSPTMENWEFLRHKDIIAQETPTLESSTSIEGVQGSGNEEVYGQTSIWSLHYSLIEDSHMTSINLKQVNWEKHKEDVGSVVENLTLTRERLPPDKENQELVAFVVEHAPPTCELGKTWEKTKIQEVSETYVIEFEYIAYFDKRR